jgi:hypothetical protein
MTPGTEPVRLLGEPKQLDTMWRPVARTVLLGLGLAGLVVLALFGAWVWAPLPLAAAWGCYELIFWLRGDRPLVATLDGTELRIVDRKGGAEHRVDLTETRAATLGVHPTRGGPDRVLVALYTDEDVLYALELATPRRPWGPAATDLARLRAALGGRPDLLRGLAPPGRFARQILLDPTGAGATALLAAIPTSAWDRAAARVWRGASPPVDFMGSHVGPPDGLLVVDDAGVRLRAAGEAFDGPLEPSPAGTGSRLIALLDREDGTTAQARLPLVLWALRPGVTLAIPAPALAGAAADTSVDDATWHTHLPEAANVVAAALRRVPDDRAPPILRAPAAG